MNKNFKLKEFDSVTAVAHAAVKNAPSGLNARTVAELMGKPYQTMMSELSGQEGHKFGADLLLPLMDVTGSYAPLEFMAREVGGAFIMLPDADVCDSKLTQGLAETMRTASEFFAIFADKIADGLVEAHELVEIEREGDDAVEAIIAIKKLARCAHEQQFGGKR